MSSPSPHAPPALQQAEAIGAVDGPLAGYHREWYVVRPEGELTRLGRVKIGEPREGVLWFDRRYFASEDELLLELARLGVPQVPPVHQVGSSVTGGAPGTPGTLGTPEMPETPDACGTPGMRGTPRTVFHGFIEGRTLEALCPSGRPVEASQMRQIMERFASLCRVRPGDVRARRLDRRGVAGDIGGGGAHFLSELIDFTRERAYLARLPRFGRLFERLGIPSDALGPRSRLAHEAARLADRPRCLLHGDLHRANLIVDPSGRLWTIDWELASFGDPLYDLATHLYLMDYPPAQHAEVIEQWQQTVAPLLPGADTQLAADLPRYLDYKRAQSVFTDVVRQAVALTEAAGSSPSGSIDVSAGISTGVSTGISTRVSADGFSDDFADRLGRTAKLVHDVLLRAAEALELTEVPSPGAIEPAYAELCTPASDS
jgi:hypothetical protein